MHRLFCEVKLPTPAPEFDPWKGEVTNDPEHPNIFRRPWFTHEEYLKHKQRNDDETV